MSSDSKSAHAHLLDVRSLSVRFGGVVAVDNVSLQVRRGEVFGLIGPNGAGKTSMIDALTGYGRPASGTVAFQGRDITSMAPHRRSRAGLARTFQSVELFNDLTIDENLLVASERGGLKSTFRDIIMPGRAPVRNDVDWAIEVCGLQDVADRYPEEVSHGQRKLVGVGRALAQRPKLVLLDEPAAGLDTDESLALGKRLQTLPAEHDVTVLLVDHDMGLVLGICDQILVLNFGKEIARGTPKQIKRDERVLEAYLGSHAAAEDAEKANT